DKTVAYAIGGVGRPDDLPGIVNRKSARVRATQSSQVTNRTGDPHERVRILVALDGRSANNHIRVIDVIWESEVAPECPKVLQRPVGIKETMGIAKIVDRNISNDIPILIDR